MNKQTQSWIHERHWGTAQATREGHPHWGPRRQGSSLAPRRPPSRASPPCASAGSPAKDPGRRANSAPWSGEQTVVSGVWPKRQGQLLTRAQTNRSCCPDRGHSSAKREGKGRHRDVQRGREDKKIRSKGAVVSAWGEWTERKNEKDAGKKDFFLHQLRTFYS